MTNSKNSKNMYDLAEKIALDDFDKLDEQHKFSDTYTHKKKLFMEEIKMKSKQPQQKRKKNRILIAAACLMIGIPTTAFGAVKVYDMIVQKQNYEVNVSVSNNASKKNNNWYKLKVNYLPENMVEIENAPMEYSFKDNYGKGGFSFYLWRVGKDSNFQTLYSKSYEEKEINGKKAVIVNKDTGNKSLAFDRQVYLLFEEEGIMVEGTIGIDVSEELMMKVMENISLEPTSKEMASFIADDSLYSEETEPTEFSVIPLKKDSKQLFSIGEKVPVTIDQISRLDNLEFVIEKVEVFDSIKDFKQDNFNEFGLGSLSKYKALDQKKKLMPYRRDVYKVGNGSDSVYELVESQLVNPKFVYLTTTVKNIGKQSIEEICMNPTIQVLKFKNNGWNYARENGIDEKSLMTGEVDYLAPHGKGKAFYYIDNILPGQTMKINLGYFVDEDKLDSIFLDAFRYGGSGTTDDMNAKDRLWIDIRG
ncbi:anti-sigma factor [Lysinibacillus sp. FJAT-14745]|uniref:anti-sigma factor n=1 Tax=Lysinibacillus sp. FJAT-14745 TaxID=1704289 RepID=UPI0006AB8F23|nr:anti-sigma factor [Lysinibacillus sp. FJAT-14745]KOP70297.1 anti-sigma factor [Lysinibacillus sp. FJAT-14745]